MKMLKTYCAILLGVALAFPAAAQELTKNDCLGCHGPVENLVKLAPMYESDSGKINPHKYAPHNEQSVDKFPDCKLCHTPHAMPAPKGFKDESANIEYCYSCHHQYNFKKCSECHK